MLLAFIAFRLGILRTSHKAQDRLHNKESADPTESVAPRLGSTALGWNLPFRTFQPWLVLKIAVAVERGAGGSEGRAGRVQGVGASPAAERRQAMG